MQCLESISRRVLVGTVVLAALSSFLVYAKGLTTKITIENRLLAGPLEIKAPEVLRNFGVFAGPGTSSNEPRSLIADWVGGKVPPPAIQFERYQVSFYVEGYPRPYVVLYVYDPSIDRGYVYIPGKADEWYRANISIIYRGVEGGWFEALPGWNNVAMPLIKAASLKRS